MRGTLTRAALFAGLVLAGITIYVHTSFVVLAGAAFAAFGATAVLLWANERKQQ